jgi:hypothetical protein
MARVYSNSVPGRVLFDGPDEQAQEWVENNFPRVHVDAANVVETPTPDVHVVLNNRQQVQFNGEKWEAVSQAKEDKK